MTKALLLKLFGAELATEVAARYFIEGQGPGGFRFRPEYFSEKVGCLGFCCLACACFFHQRWLLQVLEVSTEHDAPRRSGVRVDCCACNKDRHAVNRRSVGRHAHVQVLWEMRARPNSPDWLVEETVKIRKGLLTLRQNLVLVRDPENPEALYPRCVPHPIIGRRLRM